MAEKNLSTSKTVGEGELEAIAGGIRNIAGETDENPVGSRMIDNPAGMMKDEKPSGIFLTPSKENGAENGAVAAGCPLFLWPEMKQKNKAACVHNTGGRSGHPTPHHETGRGAAQMEQKATYKRSRYNIFIPLKRENGVLAYNGVSRTLALWNENDIAAYKNLDWLDDYPASAANLKKARFVVAADVDEVVQLRDNFQAVRAKSGFLTLTVAPTLACNFNCDYCYQGEEHKGGVMDAATGEKLLAYIDTAIKGGVKSLSVEWYGGEPLLAPELVCDLSARIIALCAAAGVKYSAGIVTNGYLLTKETVLRLRDLQVKAAQVTLDGGREQHDARRILHGGGGSFDVIIKNLKEAVLVEDFRIGIRVNIDRRNADGIEDLLEYLAASGFAGKKNFRVRFAPVDAGTSECLRVAGQQLAPADYARLEARLLLMAERKGLATAQFPRRMSVCEAVGPHGLVILPNGDVHKCWNTVADSSFCVGTLDDMDGIAESPWHQKWLSWSPFARPDCVECMLLPNCAGACAHKAIVRDASPCGSIKHNIEPTLLLLALSKGLIDWADADAAAYGLTPPLHS